MAASARHKLAGYNITIRYLPLIQPGRQFNHDIATDGRVALMDVQLS